jgi:hypothetical protein
MLGVLLVIGAAWYVDTLGPIDPYHKAVAHVLREELEQLPPYPGSVPERTVLKASIFDSESLLGVDYATAAPCDAIQAYYARSASAAGWAVVKSNQRVPTDTNPQHAELLSVYDRGAGEYDSGLTVDCFASPDFQSGYSILLQVPPP